MRLAYLDEAGASKADEEPYSVVAGIILAPDGQWNEVEAWMRSLVIETFGEDRFPSYGRHFNFHAKDIWHGSGEFPRDRWPITRRMELFERISSVPTLFELPIVYGYVKKDKFVKMYRAKRMPEKNLSNWLHAEAFMMAARRIDRWMIENTNNEVVMLIAEDTDKPMKGLIDLCHAMYVDRAINRMPGAFQAERIVEQVSFMKKNQSGILQLADWVSFIIKRYLQKCRQITPFYNNISGQLVHRARTERVLYTKLPISDLVVPDAE